MVNRISAQIIADSITERGDRLTTYILVFPRIVLAEFNTHRMISKNSASSRAIPFKTMLQKVKDEPFIPIAWQKEHKGMQGTDYFTKLNVGTPYTIYNFEDRWRDARDSAVKAAELMSNMGLTKQLCNRLLEPFLYHTVICTGSEWENFFALRAHPAAEIHIADLAEKMLVAYNESKPKLLEAGEYHIPFGDTFDEVRLFAIATENGTINYTNDTTLRARINELKRDIAIARCARVSYLNFEGKDDYMADIKLKKTLVDMGHMSPTEHVARVMSDEEFYSHGSGEGYNPFDQEGDHIFFQEEQFGWSGNFRGFIQYRKTIDGENKQDNRVVKSYLSK